MVENLPASRGHRLDAWSGKIPHAGERQSLWPRAMSVCAAAPEVQGPWGPCSATREDAAVRSPCIITRDQPRHVTTKENRATTKTQHRQKYINFFFF